MKLELPDNNASVLFHMGNALQSIARDLDVAYNNKAPLRVDTSGMTQGELQQTIKEFEVFKPVELSDTVESTMFKGIGSIDAGTDADDVDPVIEASDTIDADGLPWDQRIHSRGKTRLADNTWRMARKPNDKTDEEWAEYVETVKVELRALMAIPVATGDELDVLANIPVITAEQRAELKVHVDYAEDPNEVDPFAIEPPVVDTVVTPPVVDAVVTPPVVDTVVTPPVVDAVVTPPVVDTVVTPPVVDTVVTPPVVTGPTTFPELMKFITVNNKKLTKESVDEALKAQGLASIALLAARTDLIPQVHAALVKLL